MSQFGWVIDMDGNLYFVCGCGIDQKHYLSVTLAFSGERENIASIDEIEGCAVYTLDMLRSMRERIISFLINKERNAHAVCDLRKK